MKWTAINTGNRPENRKILEPMPDGPYIVCSQNCADIEKGERVDVFPSYYWGSQVFVKREEEFLLVAYWYDTSD